MLFLKNDGKGLQGEEPNFHQQGDNSGSQLT